MKETNFLLLALSLSLSPFSLARLTRDVLTAYVYSPAYWKNLFDMKYSHSEETTESFSEKRS